MITSKEKRKDIVNKITKVRCMSLKADNYYSCTIIGDERFLCYVNINCSITWHKKAKGKYIMKLTPFEEILKEVDKDIAVELCYHLDLFA